jgi:hypothetical protein
MIHASFDVNQIEMKRALYKTALVGCSWSCRGRPHLGRAVMRSLQNQTGLLPARVSG